MGAHLKFKLRDSVSESSEEVNEWLDSQPEQKAIRNGFSGEDEQAQIISFFDHRDQEWWVNEHGMDSPINDIGEGQVKASCTPKEAKDLWASLFEKLHSEYEVAVLASSCALTRDHLTQDQLVKITDGGSALSGDETAKRRVKMLLDGKAPPA